MKLEPGMSGKVRLDVQRLKIGFDGDVAVHHCRAGVRRGSIPDKLVIPHGKTEAEFTVVVDPNRAPGRRTIQFQGDRDRRRIRRRATQSPRRDRHPGNDRR